MKEMLKDCISLSFVSHIYIYMEEIKSKNVWIPEKLNFADCTNFCWNFANRGSIEGGNFVQREQKVIVNKRKHMEDICHFHYICSEIFNFL